jgi:hypothetical protein
MLNDSSAGQPAHASNDPPAQPALPPPFPPKIAAAWIKEGAEVGWMRRTPTDRAEVWAFLPETGGKAGDLPAFRFERWPVGRVAKLPAPASAFGLCVHLTKITDAGLKELSGLKNLQALDAAKTPVTGAGLTELAGLERLQELDLTDSGVTLTGLKHLAGLSQLRTLSIGWDQQSQLWSGPQAARRQQAEAAFAKLKQLKNLYLNFIGVRDRFTIADDSVKLLKGNLQRLLPGCHIDIRMYDKIWWVKHNFQKPKRSATPVTSFHIVWPSGTAARIGLRESSTANKVTVALNGGGVIAIAHVDENAKRPFSDKYTLRFGAPKGCSLGVGEYGVVRGYGFYYATAYTQSHFELEVESRHWLKKDTDWRNKKSTAKEEILRRYGDNGGEFVVWECEVRDHKIIRLAIDYIGRSSRGSLRYNSLFQPAIPVSGLSQGGR